MFYVLSLKIQIPNVISLIDKFILAIKHRVRRSCRAGLSLVEPEEQQRVIPPSAAPGG